MAKLYAPEETLNFLLLPGMDGTGKLFKPFIDNAPKCFDIDFVRLIQEPQISYARQAKEIAQKINNPVVLIAESYSGMVAMELLKEHPEKIKGVVFVASFIDPPSILSKLSYIVPSKLLSFLRNNSAFVGRFLFGKWGTDELIKLFVDAMLNVDEEVLKYRLTQVASIKPINSKYLTKCLYLKPSKDFLVSDNASFAFTEVFSNIEIVEVPGTHFLLQTNPKFCWEVIESAGI